MSEVTEPIEWYWKQADELAQKVVSTSVAVLPARMISDFRPLLETAYRYRSAKRRADDRRQSNSLSKLDEEEERASRQAFAEACKLFENKHGRL